MEGLQETLAEDFDTHQESLGSKRDAEEIHVGTPTKKRKYAKAKEVSQGEVKCDYCDKKYSSKNSLGAHLKKCDTAGIKKELLVESGVEGSIASDGVALDESGEVQINDETAESVVELDASLNSNQEQSEQLEQDAKKFACDLCDKRFVSEQGRRTHNTRKHGSDQPLLLACEYQDCALAFLKNSELRKHEIAMHNRVPRSWKSKNIKKEPAAGSVFECNSSADVATGSATEEEDVAAKYQDVPADSDTSMDLADVVAVDQESREAVKEGSRFVCSFGCGKSYSAKCNLSNHEIKVHNRPKLKNRKSQKPTASPKKQEEPPDEGKKS